RTAIHLRPFGLLCQWFLAGFHSYFAVFFGFSRFSTKKLDFAGFKAASEHFSNSCSPDSLSFRSVAEESAFAVAVVFAVVFIVFPPKGIDFRGANKKQIPPLRCGMTNKRLRNDKQQAQLQSQKSYMSIRPSSLAGKRGGMPERYR
ncbi:MAG: hypothetical protein P4K80_00450, partial [Acidobacteriaceae bacterium]|nr:hypothetical protein [Acidobacteriaceae bacterium]